MEYSIVVPAYNEADKITASLTQIVTFMKSFVSTFEVIVVDDGSSDATAELVEAYSHENPAVKLVRNPHKGKGYTVYTGIMLSQGDYVYIADADLSAPMSELKKLSVWAKDQGYDVVLASREGIGAQRQDEPWYRHVMGRVFNIYVQAMLLRGITDSQCGFKLFKQAVVRPIFTRLTLANENSKEISHPYTGAWDVEVLFIARKLKYKIKQVPVTWVHVRTTRVNPLRDSFKMAWEVLKIRLNDFRGKYKITHSSF